jgi:hypothetical protein
MRHPVGSELRKNDIELTASLKGSVALIQVSVRNVTLYRIGKLQLCS